MIDIAGYTILEQIGTGGMATVYKGIQNSLKRQVAIKVLHQKLADNPLVLKQFDRESFIVAQLNHPHIIHIIDRGLLKDKRPYFIMEFLEGCDLADLLKQQVLSVNKKLDILIQICKALGYAHKNGVIHRDIKPANIFIDQEHHAHVLDFGIAQFCQSQLLGPDDELVMGTLAYMAPEQKKSAANVTILSDIYSFGVLMYVLFTGQKPVANYAKPSELVDDIDPSLDHLILSCLHEDPLARPSSADKIKDGLLRLLNGTHLNHEQRDRVEQDIPSLKSQFSLLDVIKEEKYGGIYLYQNRTDQTLLVIKKRPIWLKGFEETNLVKSLSHQHIARIYGASKNERHYIVVMEYLSGGSLEDRLLVGMPWDEALRMLRGIGQGLEFAHQNNIIHGNLRPSKILFDDNGIVKLTDFGLREQADGQAAYKDYKLQSEEKSKRSDIFSLGVIAYQLLTGELPHWKNRGLGPSEKFDGLPQKVKDFIRSLVRWTPSRRPASMTQVLSEIDTLLEYHLELVLEEARLKQWREQQALEKAQEELRKARKKRIMQLTIAGSVIITTIGIALLIWWLQ